MNRPSPPRPTALSYWPHAGIAFGVLLNLAGLLLKSTDLIATGSNALTLSSVYLAQRRRKRSG